jgi:hypothetical protein
MKFLVNHLHIPEPTVKPAWIPQTVARSQLHCGWTFQFRSVRNSSGAATVTEHSSAHSVSLPVSGKINALSADACYSEAMQVFQLLQKRAGLAKSVNVLIYWFIRCLVLFLSTVLTEGCVLNRERLRLKHKTLRKETKAKSGLSILRTVCEKCWGGHEKGIKRWNEFYMWHLAVLL